MNWKTRIRERFADAGHVLDDDVLEELSTHAKSAYDALRAEGADERESERQMSVLMDTWLSEASSLRRRPSRPPVVEAPPTGTARWAGLLNDVRYAVRILMRQRGFAMLAITTMALGIGLTTTLFNVAYSVLLKPLPWAHAEQLVRLSETHQGATRRIPWIVTNAAYVAWRDNPTTIEGLGAWSKRDATVTIQGETDRMSIAAVTASLFPLLRVNPLVGRSFSVADEAASQQGGKIILSYGMWQRRFGGDPKVLEEIVRVDGKPYSVAGVMPRDFAYPDRETQAWIPFFISPGLGEDGQVHSLSMFFAIARLRDDVTPAQAAAEATARARSGPALGMVGTAVFGGNGPAEISAVPLIDALTQDVRPALIALAIAVGLLLITATANIVSLQLARASTRVREMAIRAAIGAGIRRIAQQVLVESSLLGLAGGGAGLLLAVAVQSNLPSLLPTDFPRLNDIAMDWRVTLFACFCMVAIILMVSIVPVLHVRRFRLVEALMENGAGSTTAHRSGVGRARMVIMVAQVGIACVLLVGSALLSRSFLSMMHADRGYDPTNILTARLSMPDFAFSSQRRIDVLETTLERLRALPSVVRAEFTTGLPLSGSETLSAFTMPSKRPPVGTPIQVHTVRAVVTDGYFAALGMRIVEGRGFTKSDSANTPKVIVVNRSFARQYLSDKPIGDKIANFARGDGVEFEVVGVVDDVLKRGVSDGAQPEVYSLDRQMLPTNFNPDAGNFAIRTSGDPRTLIEPLRSIVREQDSFMTVSSLHSMEDRVSSSLARPRLYAVLLTTFALSALIIASVGVFGVLSYTVAQRTREIAVRTALGARRSDVAGLVFRQGFVLVATGLALGLAVSFAAAQYLSTLLYGVAPHDWLSFAAVSLTIAVIAFIACLVPALRAARTNPLIAMRSA